MRILGGLQHVHEISRKGMALAREFKRQRLGIPQFAETLGLKINYDPYLPNTIGGYPLTVDGVKLITVNPNWGKKRVEFSIVHEIAHHTFKHAHSADLIHKQRELEANWFSAQFFIGAFSSSELAEYWQQNPELPLMGFAGMIALGTSVIAGGAWALLKLMSQKSDQPQ